MNKLCSVAFFGPLVSLIMLGTASTTYAQQVDLPRIPDYPTHEQCSAYRAHIGRISSAIVERHSQCLDTNSGSRGGHCQSAYSECANECSNTPCCRLHVASCEVQAYGRREAEKCRKRAQQLEDFAKAAKAEQVARNRALTEALREADARHEQFNQARTLVESPRAFVQSLASNLAGTSTDNALKWLSPLQKSVEIGDPRSAELFDGLFYSARKGMQFAPSNAVRSWIGERGISHLEFQMRSIYGELLNSLALLESYDPALAYSQLYTAYKPMPPPARSQSSAIDCSVFTDPSRSAALRENDEDSWFSLLERCER